MYIFIFADWEFMEMNNSVYGNPSSLTIHNEKNTKTGKIFQVIYIFSINMISYISLIRELKN